MLSSRAVSTARAMPAATQAQAHRLRSSSGFLSGQALLPAGPPPHASRRTTSTAKGLLIQCYHHREAKMLLPEKMEQKFEIKREIGRGSFGIVHEVVHRKTGATYAIKTMKLPRNLRAQEKQQCEIDVLSLVGRCLNICTLYQVFQTPGHVHMVMELCTGGTLQKRLAEETGGHYSEARVAEIMRDILRTIAQCHKCHVVHRDIKPENFLFHHDGEGAPLKAIDFGLAIHTPRGTRLTERCGTAHFMAPEVVQKSYGPECDVWSAGVTAYMLLCGHVPFAADDVRDFDEEAVLERVLTEDLDTESGDWQSVSQGAKDFVRVLLQRDPQKRPTAMQALQHPWVREGGAASASRDSRLSSDVVRRLQMFGTSDALKKAVLRELAKKISTSEDPEVRRVRSLFVELGGEDSESEHGNLTFQDLREGLEALTRAGGNHLTDAEIWEIASQLEENSEECAIVFFDGKPGANADGAEACPDIVFADLLAAVLNWERIQDRADWLDMAKEVFESIDGDGDGSLTIEELQRTLLPRESVGDLREMLRDIEGVEGDQLGWSQFLSMLGMKSIEDSVELYSAVGSADP